MSRSLEPATLLLGLRASTATLLADVDAHATDSDLIGAPSAAQGWSRGHVLAHLAGNADSNALAISSAMSGSPQPSYPGAPDAGRPDAGRPDPGRPDPGRPDAGRPDSGRDAEIAARAQLSAAELVALLHESCARLDRVFAAAADAAQWDLATLDRGTVAECVQFRWREVEIHHVDLRLGHHPADWPATFVRWLLPTLATELTARTPQPYRLVVTAGSSAPDLVGTEYGDGDGTELAAPDHALLAWLVGRPEGAPAGRPDWPVLPFWD